MAHIKGKINLSKMVHVISKTAKGTECIVIPIKENDLFKSEKGNVFMDLVLWEQKEDKREYGQFKIAQSYSEKKQAEIDALNKGKEKKEMIYPPTLGNADFIGVKNNEVESPIVDDFTASGDNMPF
jgi:ribosome-binding ATPase YchF (GTP1/OBG family)